MDVDFHDFFYLPFLRNSIVSAAMPEHRRWPTFEERMSKSFGESMFHLGMAYIVKINK